ncbi:MAG: hypothetical protein VB957_06325 [Pseudomonadales bacterium]
MTNRRAFLKNAISTGIASSTAMAGYAIANRRELAGQAKELGQDTIEKVRKQMEALETRVDKMEHHHQNLLRFGAIGLAISTGVDLTLFL